MRKQNFIVYLLAHPELHATRVVSKQNKKENKLAREKRRKIFKSHEHIIPFQQVLCLLSTITEADLNCRFSISIRSLSQANTSHCSRLQIIIIFVSLSLRPLVSPDVNGALWSRKLFAFSVTNFAFAVLFQIKATTKREKNVAICVSVFHSFGSKWKRSKFVCVTNVFLVII